MEPRAFLADLAERVLAGEAPTRGDLGAVLRLGDDSLADVLHAAYRVRERHWGRRVKLCMLRNARSGLCPEDCGYCSQSAVSTAPIAKYRMQSEDELLEGARAAVSRGARRYCMVASGRGPSERDIDRLTAATRRIRGEYPDLEICVSLGLTTLEQAVDLERAGVGWVNHNLNTSERFYPEICSTHTYADRVATVRNVVQAGMRTCCGAIVGMGESHDDLVDLALALRELRVDSLPVNFLLSIEGTPLENRHDLTPAHCLRALSMFRFANPAAEVRVAGGREVNLGWFQALALYPANSIFIEGYLTTPGQGASAAQRMVQEMGFEVESETTAAHVA